MADDRLHQESGERRRYPKCGKIVEARPKRLEDAAHIGVLEREADLDPKEAEGDVP
jgi:hypothetical protein